MKQLNSKERISNTLVASLWLVFMIPLIGYGQQVLATAEFTAMLGLLAAFALNYLLSFFRYPHALTQCTLTGRSPTGCWVHYGIALLLVFIPLFWWGWWISLFPYLQALAAYTLPQKISRWQFPVLATVAVLLMSLGAADWAVSGMLVGMVFVQVFSNMNRREVHAQAQSVSQARLRERDRIAKDMHDLLGHSLTVMALKAQVVQRLSRTDPACAEEQAGELHQQIRQALAQLRATVGALHTMDLQEQLTAAGQALAQAGIDLAIRDMRSKPSSIQGPIEAVYAWVTREAITNVIRHSGAHRVNIELSDTRLVISDDGCGFDPANTPDTTGVASMRSRAEAAGLCLRIRRAEPGTKVELQPRKGKEAGR